MVKSESTEQKILDAARTVFIRKGLAGARMQEIANEAGINKALLHYYFRSKEKLFDHIFTETIKTFALGFSSALQSELPLKEKIKSMIDIYLTILEKNSYLPSFVLFELQQNPDKIGAIFRQYLSNNVPAFFNEVMKAINTGEIRPVHPVHLMLNLLGMIIFPYAARPVLNSFLKENARINIDDVLKERKEVIYDFVINAIFINKDKK